MDLIIGVTTYNRIDFLKRFIKTWYKTRSKNHHWTLIVADDGSTDGTIEYLEPLCLKSVDIRIIKNSRRGVHFQTNKLLQAMAKMDFDYAFKADDDIEFINFGWDEHYIEAIKRTGFDHLCYFDPEWSKKYCQGAQQIDPPYKRDGLECKTPLRTVFGSFWTVTPRVLDKVGFFDVDVFGLCLLGHVDYTARCCLAGFNDINNPFDVEGSTDYIKMPMDDYERSVKRSETPLNSAQEIEHKRTYIGREGRIYIPYKEISINMNGDPIEEPLQVIVADSNGTHFKWLNNFCDYLARRNFGVQKVNGWGKDVNWWKDIINGATMVFLWNGAHPIFLPIIEACNQLSVPYSILEVGWFPQKSHYFVDPTGINCRSSIMNDDLSWISDRQYDRLDYFRRHYIGDKKWKGGDSVLVPLQLAEDMNWILDGNVGSMQDFINHVEQRFENVIFKRHPLDKNNYKTKSKMVTSGDFLEMAQEASLVYGVNSTCLLEAALMGVPVKSVGGGYLRAHESQIEVLLAALADKQIHVDEPELDYWFGDILANNQEKALGHSEISWGALINSAIVIIPCRNCEKFIADCLDSLTSQTWKDLGIIVIDDCSDDKTSQVAREHLKGIEHLVIKNSKRCWALRNIDTAITAYCDNPDSVIFLLDGDDYLIDDRAIEKMMNSHESKDVVWSSYKTDVEGWAHKGGMMDSRVPIRAQLWNMSPLRSFKKFLFDAIDRNYFIDSDGTYFKVTWDQAIMFPIAEMSGASQWRFIPEQFYYYRMHENNDHNNDGRQEQIRAESVVRKKPSAKLMGRYNNSDVTVIVSCFNQLYVLPLFLESMFFQTQLPREVIVADDGSSDGVCEWVEENAHRYPFKLSYVTRAHEGYRLASLNNFAASQVCTGKILFTNADVLHSPDSIKAHSRAKDVAGGVVMGIATARANKVEINDVRDYNALLKIQKSSPSWRHNMKFIKSTNPNHNPIGVWGGNFSVPADKLHEVNGFDEGFKGWGGEDNELVVRLIKVGCKVEWAMDSEAIHLDHENKKYAYDQSGSNYYLSKLNG